MPLVLKCQCQEGVSDEILLPFLVVKGSCHRVHDSDRTPFTGPGGGGSKRL